MNLRLSKTWLEWRLTLRLWAQVRSSMCGAAAAHENEGYVC